MMFQNFFNYKIINKENSGVYWNEHLEIVFVLEGEGTLILDGSKEYYKLKKSDIFVINGYHPRDITMLDNGVAIALYLDYNFVISSNPETNSPYFECKSFINGVNQQEDFDELRRSFAEAFKSFYKNESNLSVLMRSKLTHLMSVLYTYFYVEEQKINFKSLDRIRYTVNYIHHNFKENITLTELAENVNLSSAYLSRIFKSTIGTNVTEYIAQLRMNYAIKLLPSEKNITEIAYESGFANPNAMISTFNKYKKMTPGQYRQKYARSKIQSSQCVENEKGFSNAFDTLLEYIPKYVDPINDVVPRQIKISMERPGIPIDRPWNKILNVGYANNLLNIENQNLIRHMQSNLEFKYVRVKGIFDDDMYIYSKDIGYKFGHVFKALDFIIELNAIPLIEIGHMPQFLSNQQGFNLRRESSISVPKDLDQWKALLTNFFDELMMRYGEKVKTWLFSPWITMEYVIMSPFTVDEYFKTYGISYDIIKGFIPEAKIVGPGINISNYDKINLFLSKIEEYGIKIDLFSFKSYAAEIETAKNGDLALKITKEAFPFAVSEDENYLKNAIHNVKSILNDFGYGNAEIIIEEWNSNVWQRDYCSDTTYKSCYIFKNILETQDEISAISYYSLSDSLNEITPSEELFSGGFGLYTWNNIPKSAYYAFQLLNRSGDILIKQDDAYCIMKKDNVYQIYLYNYAHYDLLYRYRHVSNMTPLNRYGVFNHKETIGFKFKFEDAPKGRYKITYHYINKESGSAFDIWLKMGAPENMNADEINYLKNKSIPGLCCEIINVEDIIDIMVNVDPHEVVLVEINKIA